MTEDTGACYGLGCLSMQELYDFILQVKEMDLYSRSRQYCCGDGLIEGNCECDPDIAANEEDRFEEQCMFGQCMSWE